MLHFLFASQTPFLMLLPFALLNTPKNDTLFSTHAYEIAHLIPDIARVIMT
jgi:hypothetical protein